MKNAYLRFVALANVLTAKEVVEHHDVDEEARRILELIAIQEMQGRRLTVTEAMTMSEIASPATIHRKINVLIHAGLLEFSYEGKNRRTKFLKPTQQAHHWFESLGEAMGEVILKTA